jgi:hypothetical protein
MKEHELSLRELELREREVRALERIADRSPTPVKRTWRDRWNGVPHGQEHNRESYIQYLTTVRY